MRLSFTIAVLALAVSLSSHGIDNYSHCAMGANEYVCDEGDGVTTITPYSSLEKGERPKVWRAKKSKRWWTKKSKKGKRKNHRLNGSNSFPDGNSWSVVTLSSNICRNERATDSKLSDLQREFVSQDILLGSCDQPKVAAYVRNEQNNLFGLKCESGALYPYMVLQGSHQDSNINGEIVVNSNKPIQLGKMTLQKASQDNTTWIELVTALSDDVRNQLVAQLAGGTKSTVKLSMGVEGSSLFQSAEKSFIFSLRGSKKALSAAQKKCSDLIALPRN